LTLTRIRLWRQVKVTLNIYSWWSNPPGFKSQSHHLLCLLFFFSIFSLNKVFSFLLTSTIRNRTYYNAAKVSNNTKISVVEGDLLLPDIGLSEASTGIGREGRGDDISVKEIDMIDCPMSRCLGLLTPEEQHEDIFSIYV
jgi:hypothetical protein